MSSYFANISVNPITLLLKYYQLHLQMKKLRHKGLIIKNLSKTISLKMLRRNLNIGHLNAELWSTDQHPVGNLTAGNQEKEQLQESAHQHANPLDFPQQGGPYSAEVKLRILTVF